MRRAMFALAVWLALPALAQDVPGRYRMGQWNLVITSPADTVKYEPMPYNWLGPLTIAGVRCIVDPDESDAAPETVVLTLQECDTTCDNCTTIEQLTADKDGTTVTEGNIDDTAFAANGCLGVLGGAVTTAGAVLRVECSIAWRQ